MILKSGNCNEFIEKNFEENAFERIRQKGDEMKHKANAKNNLGLNCSTGKTIHQLFEEQLEQWGDSIALVSHTTWRGEQGQKKNLERFSLSSSPLS